ncbi:MAG: glycosyltransferase family 39 protein [Myxococcales bacterium]|nr:glycosyltransferase family 39 protein [Myxococcales bacterium]MCB9715806.1 glycosyltransferase family 39 protein [Myxococcales bacterium]
MPLLLLLGLVLLVGVRLHVLDDDFPNPDIAGIVYNAELVLDGGRPYLETAEIKPPGAFLMAAASIAVLGRSLVALQLLHALWLAVGGLGVWWAARAVHDDEGDPRLGPRCAALGVVVYLVSAAMFSYNYSSWMTPAYALATGAALRGLRRDRARDQLLAGAMALLAFVTIQRAAVLALLLPTLWLWARRRGLMGARPRVLGLWLVGALLAVLPLLAWYAGVGEGGTLLRALLPLGVGMDYTASSDGSGLATLLAALAQLGRVFWFPVGLVLLAALATALERERARELGAWRPGLAWLAVSILGAGLGGGRFYLHYLVQYAPALGLLAASPAIVRAVTKATASPPAEDRGRARVVVGLLVLLSIAQLVEIGLGRGHRYEAQARRLVGGLTASQAAGAHIRERTAPGDTVQAWGWTAWRIYYWSERRAPGRIYKPLGSVTTFNTNTAFDAGSGVRFRPGPLADEMVAAFDRAPPAYLVYSPSMVDAFGARPEPLEEFTELRRRIEAGYVLEAQYGDLRLLRRRR